MNSLSRIKLWLALCLALAGLSGQASPVLSAGFDTNHIIADGALLPAGTLALAGVRLGWRRKRHGVG